MLMGVGEMRVLYQRHGAFTLIVLLLVTLSVASCAKSQPVATPAPATPAPAPVTAPAPVATPAPTAPEAQQIRGFGDLFATTTVPGGPKLNVAALEKNKSVQLVLKYNVNAQPLWTKAMYGGEVVAATTLGGQLSNPILDPLKGTGRRNHYYGRLLYYDQGLCSWVGREDFSRCNGRYAENNAVLIVPGLIQSWEQPDPVTYVFHVRKGALWPAIPPMNRTDREVIADDVKWFFDITKKEGQLKGSFADLVSLDVLDRYTLKLTTATPLPDFLRTVAQSGVGMFAKECYDAQGCLGSKLITPGPWLLKEYTPRQRAVLEKNPEFFLKGLPYIDRWIYLNMTDPSALKAAFTTGQVIAYRTYTEEDALSAQKQSPGSFVGLMPSAASGTGLRPRLEGPMADVRVRRALALAVNMQEVWDLSSDGLGLLPTEFGRDLFGLGKSFYLSLDNAGEWYRYDPVRAKQLLTEAGYGAGFKTLIRASASFGQGYDILTALQAQWKKINVDLQISVVDATALTAALTGKRWEGFISNLTSASWTDGNTGFISYLKGSPFNYQDIDDPVITDLHLRASREMDPAKRAALLWQSEERVLDQLYVLRINHVWPFDVWQASEINGATHSWDYYYSLGVMWLSMQDPSKVRR